jgi:hypothetical protein
VKGWEISFAVCLPSNYNSLNIREKIIAEVIEFVNFWNKLEITTNRQYSSLMMIVLIFTKNACNEFNSCEIYWTLLRINK